MHLNHLVELKGLISLAWIVFGRVCLSEAVSPVRTWWLLVAGMIFQGHSSQVYGIFSFIR